MRLAWPGASRSTRMNSSPGLREEMRAEIDALHDALPRLEFLQIAGRREGAMKLTPLDAAPEPHNLPEQRGCSLRPAPQQLARLAVMTVTPLIAWCSCWMTRPGTTRCAGSR